MAQRLRKFNHLKINNIYMIYILLESEIRKRRYRFISFSHLNSKVFICKNSWYTVYHRPEVNFQLRYNVKCYIQCTLFLKQLCIYWLFNTLMFMLYISFLKQLCIFWLINQCSCYIFYYSSSCWYFLLIHWCPCYIFYLDSFLKIINVHAT